VLIHLWKTRNTAEKVANGFFCSANNATMVALSNPPLNDVPTVTSERQALFNRML
jgi:hypothetical protein